MFKHKYVTRSEKWLSEGCSPVLVFSSDVTLHSGDIAVRVTIRYQSVLPEHNQLERCFVTGNGLEIELPILGVGTFTFALILFTVCRSFEMYLAIPLVRWRARELGSWACVLPT